MYKILICVLLIVLIAGCSEKVPDYAPEVGDGWVDIDADSTNDIFFSVRLAGDSAKAGFVTFGKFDSIGKYAGVTMDVPNATLDMMYCGLSDYDGSHEWDFSGLRFEQILSDIQASKNLSDTATYVLTCHCNFEMESLPEYVDLKYKLRANEKLIEGSMRFKKYETDTSKGVMRWH